MGKKRDILDDNLLGAKEEIIKKLAIEYGIVSQQMTGLRAEMMEAVKTYQLDREVLQREKWNKTGLSWCSNCRKFFPKKEMGHVYTIINSWERLYLDGQRVLRQVGTRRILNIYCQGCIIYFLSSSYLGNPENDSFQNVLYFLAKHHKENPNIFMVFRDGEWREIPTGVELNSGTETNEKIKEEEFDVGKEIKLSWHPEFSLWIGNEKLI